MTIHTGHPFAEPEDSRDPVRRFRGRLGGAVTLWTAGSGTGRAGLTVSSLMVASGQPARLLALVDPDSDLLAALEETGLAVVQLLSWRHRALAEVFAGLAPSPGGPFRAGEFTDTGWGPALTDTDGWAGVGLESAVPVGWSSLVTAVIEEVTLADDSPPLLHRRGRYLRPPAEPGR